MNWQKEIPAVAGIYWVCYDTPEPVKVSIDDQKRVWPWYSDGIQRGWHIIECCTRFMGPIVEVKPDPPTDMPIPEWAHIPTTYPRSGIE
jgi:hypothetical protein